MKENSNTVNDVYDIIIIGGGPAGLTAGLYASRARMKTLLIESMSVMGEATMTDLIENYPGVEKMNGFDLVATFKKQAVSFGLECVMGTVSNVASRSGKGAAPVWRVEDENGAKEALSAIIASGARPKKLMVPGEDEFLGKGISYCATCDGAFFREKDIVVVGGGDTAVEEAVFLTRFGKTVTIIHRRDRLRAAKILQERAVADEKIKFILGSTVEEIYGGNKVEGVRVKNRDTGEITDKACDGVFIFAGWEPNTGFLAGTVQMDKYGHIMTDEGMSASAEGAFACGDCRAKLLRQVITACGDGATAAFSAQKYVEEIKGVAYK
ncbi:MAG: thioredoxin-disulfide reductase [Candidatus Omnitrophota bacterium]